MQSRLRSAYSLGLGAFVMLSSEFMPMGLMTPISESFGQSESVTGIMIFAYAVSVAALSVPLMVWASRMAPKKLMLLLMCLFCAGQTLSALAPVFWFLVAARLLVACAHAIFWAAAPPLAVRIAGEELRSSAMGIVATGGTLAQIAGLPLGRSLGLIFGWRMSFVSLALLAALTIFLIAKTLPELEAGPAFAVGRLPELIRGRALATSCIFTLIICVGYYGAYSFIEPSLLKLGHLSPEAVTWLLALYGLFGFVGARLFARFYNGREYLFVKGSVTALAASLFVLQAGLMLPLPLLLFVAAAGMGLFSVAFNISTQGIILDCVHPDDAAVATALYSGMYNFGVGVGGFVASGLAAVSLALINPVSALLVSASAAFVFFCLIPALISSAYTKRNG